jgi:hypothetical protein
VNQFAQASKNIVLIYLALLALIMPERIFAADPYADAARELAGKIAANLGPTTEVGFAFQALASLETEEVVLARQAIENELRARGLKIVKDSQSSEKVSITLAETFQQYIWVAEIRRERGNRVVMTTQPRTASKDEALRMTIQSRLLYEQGDPILDVKPIGDEMLVLDPKRLALFRRQNDRWTVAASVPLKPPHSFPRDVRGRLEDAGDAIKAHLPGLSCTGTVKPAFELNCSQDETPWPLGLGSTTPAFSKNFFTQEKIPAFFSAARVEDDGTDLLVITGTDGRTSLFDEATGQAGTIDGWGSEIAAVDSGCGGRRQVFAALSTDPREHGVIQAFEIAHRKAVATSSTVPFPGPITSLWPVTNQNAAIAVSRNIKTGRYAAYYLSIACSR